MRLLMRVGAMGLALAVVLTVGLAAPAGALPIEIGYTLDDPPGSVPFAAGGATGFVNPFTGFQGHISDLKIQIRTPLFIPAVMRRWLDH